MAKLREIDKRPKHQFSPGDIVSWKRGTGAGSEGIIIATRAEAGRRGQNGYQECWAVFAPREFDLYQAARQSISMKEDLSEDIMGVRISNTQIEFLRKCPESWMTGISASEVMLMRFQYIAEED